MDDKRIEVLLVEDNPEDALLIREMLAEVRGMTFGLECTDRLSTGLERLAAGGIDVVVLDLELPDSHGLDAFTRAYAQAPDVPMIVLSGLDDEMLAVKAVRGGAQDYLVKGQMDGDLLARAMRYAIERQQAEKALQSSEARFRALIEKNADGIIVADKEGVVRFVNPAAEALLGRQAEDLVGELFGFPVVAGETEEVDIVRRSGERVVAEMRVVEMEWEGESACLASLRDITERVRMAEALGKRMKELTCLYAVNHDVREDLAVDELCRRVIEHLIPAMKFPEIAVPVIELDGRRFTSERTTGGLSHGLHAEIRMEGEARGHLGVYYAEERPFLIPEEQDFLNTIGEDLGLWLERKRAREELQNSLAKLRKALGGTIQAIALTVEAKDPYTAGHQRRVANLARAIATEMDLPKEQIDGIRMAGAIHDIGKITVPSEILSKPGITALEFSLIKTHPQVGYNILKEIDFPWPVAEIVLQHHERMDGSGYPQGLSDGEIMLEARILAVADVVEAMFSHRPYRPSRGLDKALEEVSQNRGILYDAQAVGACLKLFTEKGFTFE